jgi:hypothetical protein
MKTNKKKRTVVCQHYLTCKPEFGCPNGAREPHIESLMCGGFTCEVTHVRVCCVPVKEPTYNNDDYLERLGISE